MTEAMIVMQAVGMLHPHLCDPHVTGACLCELSCLAGPRLLLSEHRCPSILQTKQPRVSGQVHMPRIR